MHRHYIAIVEFHTSGDQSMLESLRDKLGALFDANDTELENILSIFEKV